MGNLETVSFHGTRSNYEVFLVFFYFFYFYTLYYLKMNSVVFPKSKIKIGRFFYTIKESKIDVVRGRKEIFVRSTGTARYFRYDIKLQQTVRHQTRLWDVHEKTYI